MLKQLLKFFWPFCIVLLLSTQTLWAQLGCGGFNGAPQPSGGPQSVTNGQICLNQPGAPAQITVTATNVADGNNPNNFAVEIDWDDGSPRQIVRFGGPIPVNNTGPHAYTIPIINHVFLPRPCAARPGAECAYRPRVFLRIAGVTCPAQFGSSPDFFRFNTDDQCSGDMELSETATGANVFLVCAGATTTVTFTDRTILNCLPPQELTGLNSTFRERRFVYGTVNSITGPVLIAGAPQVFAFNGPIVPSGQPLNNSAPPFANNNTLTITIPATALPNQEFHIRMDYWNFCNLRPAPAVSQTGIIRVVDQPVAPTAVDQNICNGTSPLPNFRINFAPASSAVLWFRDNAGVPGAAVANPNGGNSKNFPGGSFPGGITTTTAGVYRMWASYRAQVGAGSLICESVKVPVTITIRETVPTPGPVSGTAVICNGAPPVPFGVPFPASAFPFGGSTEYIWEVVNASNAVVTDVTLTPSSGSNAVAQNILADFNIANGTFGAATSVTRKIRVRRRYTNPTTFPNPAPFSQCPSNFAEFSVTVHRNTDAGSITGGDTKCEGETLAPISWTPGIGNITLWQVSVNGGPFGTVVPFANNNPVNPSTLGLAVVLGAPTTYRFLARIQNGNCGPLSTNIVVYTINPNTDVAAAGPDDATCVPAGPLVYNLVGNTPDPGVTGDWDQISGPGTSVFSDQTLATSTVTVSVAGIYVFRWTLDNVTCQSVDDVEIQFGRLPAVPVPTPDDFCGLTGTLTAVAPAGGEIIEWSLVGGPGTAVIANDDQIPTSVTVSAVGSYTFQLRFSSGSCPPTTTNVAINFYQPATSTPEADKTVCVDGNVLPGPIAAFPITGTVGGGASLGRWQVDAPGTGTFTSSNLATGSDFPAGTINDNYRPSAADFALPTVTLRLVGVHPQPATCSNVSNTVVITFDKKPADAVVGSAIQVCGTTANLNATAPTESGVGSWSAITVGPSITDPTDRLSGVTDLEFGANVFRWSINSALGTCTVTPADFTINRTTAPNVVNISPSDLCETIANTGIAQNVDLAANYDDLVKGGVVPTVVVEWFTTAARTPAVAVPNVNNEDVTDGEIYYVRVSTTSVPICSSDGVVNFTINPKPFVANLNPSTCEEVSGVGEINNIDLTSVAYSDAVAVAAADRTVTWFTDINLTSAVATPTDVDNITDGMTFYARVENDLTGCFNTAEVVFDVNPIPADNPISGPNTVCLDPTEVIFFKVATLKANHTYQWNIPATATVIGPTNDFYVLLQFPTVVPGGITIEVQETSPEGCPGVLQDLLITIEDNPGSLAITGPSEVCENETDVIFTVPLFSNLTYAWSVPPGASIILGQGTEEIHVNFGTIAGDVIVTPSTTVGCVGPTATQPVTINRRPVMAILNKTVCSQVNAEIALAVAALSEPATDYNYISRVLDGGLFIMNAATTPPQNPVAADVLRFDNFENKTGGPLNVRYTVSGISAKGCEGPSSFITLRVNPEPQLDPSLGQAVCSDEPTEITLRPSVGSAFADRYIINTITPNGLVNSSPLPALNTQLTDQAIFNNTWTNIGTAQVDVVYDISAYNTITQCLGQLTPLTVSVFPEPVITPVGPFTICSEDALNIPLNSSITGASIVWTINQISGNIMGATASNGANITDILINNDLVQGFVEYSVQATNPLALLACEGPPLIVRVNVDPKPVVNNIVGKKCSDAVGGNIFTESLTSLEPSISSSPGTSFSWFKDLLLTLPMTPAEVAAYPLQSGVKVYAQVTNTLSGCSQVAIVEYEVTPNVSLALTTLDRNGYNLFCANDNSGQLTTVVAGGTSPYTYSVNGGPLISSNGNYTFNTLPGGILQTVIVIDKNGCTANDSRTLIEPPPLGGGVNIVQEISCFLEKDGIIEAVATGGTGTYTYLLIQTNTSNSTGLFANLGDGDYSVRITDNNGCTFDTQPLQQLRQPTQVTLDADVVAELGCKDALDGQIDVLATGGTPGYTYTLVRSGDPVNPFQVSATGPFQNLPFGSYTIIARDQNNCPSPTVALKIDNPPVFNPGRIGDDQSICLGATPSKIVELVPAFGGVGNYTYSWEASFTGLANDWTDIGHSGQEFQPNVLPDTTYYRRTVMSGTCPPLTSAMVKIYVNPLPRVTFTSPLDVCQGDGFFLQVNLLEGTAPIEYDYSAGSTTFTNLTGLSPTNIPVSNFQENTTYTLLRVKDFNGCLSPDVPLAQDVKLIRINSDFEVLAPDAQCSGGTFSFQWMVEDGIKYTWEWTDGTQTIINNPLNAGPDDRPLGLQTITHIFAGGSTEDSTVYPVRLWAQNALCDAQYTIKDVTVFPNIILNILPGDLALCSGETTRFRDQSVGVDAGTWYYRVKGTTDRSEERAGPVPIMEYQLTNITTSNPIIYEVIYEATNDEGCTAQYMQEIKVYRGVTADIIASPKPQNDFIGGVSTVTFTNNSNPLDAADFDYTWDFDDIKASIPNGSGTGNFVVSYFSADSRNVTLKAINRTARIDGKTCESIDIEPIMIHLPLLEARFKATPLASCFPTDITVQNLSPGADTFAWELFNQSGLVATSNLANPVFRILAPGTYDIFLKASYLATGQESEAKQLGIEVFDRPSSLFELRPNPLYVPDTEMQTFNKSLRANLYEWNFDDGGTSNEFEPRYFYKLEGKYKVMLVAGFDNGNKDIDGDGILDGNVICYDTTRQDLVALDGGYIKLPNAFTPSPTGSSGGVSGNGTFNDVFLPIMRGVEEFQMQIFDRWGTLIFQTKDKDIGWDGYDRNGTAMPAGVYVYKLVMRLSDGQRTTKIGDVTLIK